MRIAIEEWKGRKVVVARDDRQRLISWTPKTLTLAQHTAIFRANNSFDPNTETITVGTRGTTQRFTVLEDDTRLPKRYQIVVRYSVVVKGRQLTATGYSNRVTGKAELEDAMQQADERALAILATRMGLRYDDRIGEDIFTHAKRKRREVKVVSFHFKADRTKTKS